MENGLGAHLGEHLNFIYISTEEEALFKWKPPQSFKSYLLDMNIVRENKMEDVFFHINKGNMKIAYIRKGELIYAIGSDECVQFQILEAILEETYQQFNEMYDVKVILSYGNVSANTFVGFKSVLDPLIKDFLRSDAIKKVTVHCRVCDKMLPLYLKKSYIENADSYPVSIVYNHKGHAILCFIDKNYGVRGVELVSMTG